MRNQPIEEFLGRLSDRIPAPGGGAVAALHTAQAAALLAMVARYSDGAGNAEHVEVVQRVREQADALRDESLQLADDAERVGAAEPSVDVIAASARLVVLAEQLLPASNPEVAAEVVASVEAVRAAATTSRVAIEVNLGGVTDEGARERLAAVAAGADTIAARADAVTAAVRERLTG